MHLEFRHSRNTGMHPGPQYEQSADKSHGAMIAGDEDHLKFILFMHSPLAKCLKLKMCWGVGDHPCGGAAHDWWWDAKTLGHPGGEHAKLCSLSLGGDQAWTNRLSPSVSHWMLTCWTDDDLPIFFWCQIDQIHLSRFHSCQSVKQKSAKSYNNQLYLLALGSQGSYLLLWTHQFQTFINF